jgi:phage terminase small subunit
MTTDSKKRKASAPNHLSVPARRLWRSLFDTYQIDLPASLLLLTTLCEGWDRARQCREALKGQPLTVTDKHGGIRISPLIVEERACREQITRLARVLRIHVEEDDAR